MKSKEQLKERFVNLAVRFDLDSERAERVFDELVKRYEEPHRHYHNLDHICAVLELFDTVQQRIPQVVIDAELYRIEMAIWYHDAVYQPGKKDNEEKSAELIKYLGLDPCNEARIRLLILGTKHENPFPYPGDESAKLLADLDMAILGVDWSEYKTYSENIRKEFCAVSDCVYAVGRTIFLRSLVAPGYDSVFLTNTIGPLYEHAAKKNIHAELLLLKPDLPQFEVITVQQVSEISRQVIHATSEREAVEYSKNNDARNIHAIDIGTPNISAKRI